jgi:hypothetical protein
LAFLKRFLPERDADASSGGRPLPYLLRAWQGVLIATVLAVGLTLFELRGSWDRKADPVVPMMVPFFAMGAVGIGVVWERGGNLVWAGVLLFSLAVFFVISRVPPMSDLEHGQWAMGIPMTLVLIVLCAVPVFQMMAIEAQDPRKTAGKA